MLNGWQTAKEDLDQLRREWNLPSLSFCDVVHVIGIASVAGLLTECGASPRVISWYARRGVQG